MDKFPGTSGESDTSKEKSAKPKDTTAKAKKIGSITQFSVEKNAKPPVETVSLDSLIAAKPPAEKEVPKKAEKPQIERAETEKSAEAPVLTEPSGDVVKEQLESDVIDLKQEVATAADTPERLKSGMVLDLKESLNEIFDDTEIDKDAQIDTEAARVLSEVADLSDEEAEIEPEDTTTSSAPPIGDIPKKPAGWVGMNAGGAGGNNRPPHPPQPPQNPPPSQPPRPPRNNPPIGPTGPMSGGPGTSPNAPAAQFNPNFNRSPAVNVPEKSKKAGAFLLGGMLGYVVGRRGGRKRTEKRLNPEVSKLQNEVKVTQQKLASKETEIKQAVEQKVREQHAKKHERSAEKSHSKPVREILRQTVTAPERSAPRPQAEIVPAVAKETADQIPRPTINLEKISKPDVAPQQEIKRIEQLSTPELLTMAQTIYIEGTNVRQLYETNQIDRRGLVAIVQEGMRGGNIAHVFETVELGRERQVERAREFRHDDPSFSQSDDDDVQAVAPKQVAMPNNPDLSSLQPISNTTTAPNTHLQPDTNISPKPETRHTVESRQTLIAASTVIGIGLALWLVWQLLS